MARYELIDGITAITCLEAEDLADLTDVQLQDLYDEERDIFNRLDPWEYGV